MTRRPKLTSQNVKRSIVIGGRKTSIGLEGAFWVSLKDIAAREHISVSALATRIDTDRDHANLSSVIRVFVLEHYRRQAEQAAANAKGKQ